MSEDHKAQAAAAAAAAVRAGMRLGLGSGSTVNLVVAALGERAQRGQLAGLRIVVASRRTEAAARAVGLAVTTLDDMPELELAIDGADEIDPQRCVIKGGGGAMLRERIVLAAANQRLIVVDDSKLVGVLGERRTVPVEVVQFGWRVAAAELQRRGLQPQMRMDHAVPFVTDEGNYIFDCRTGPIADVLALATALRSIPGVIDHGLFTNIADRVLVGTTNGVRDL